MPAGLFDDDEVRVLIDDVEVERFRLRAAALTGSGMSTTIVSPACTTRFGRTACPATVTLPSLMSR